MSRFTGFARVGDGLAADFCLWIGDGDDWRTCGLSTGADAFGRENVYAGFGVAIDYLALLTGEEVFFGSDNFGRFGFTGDLALKAGLLVVSIF